MSSFDELQKRVEAAERQFNAISRQRRDYGQRLIDMIAMHERNLAESGEQVHVLRQEAAEARALAEERGRALEKARGENEQLRHMLHSLLTAIERNRSNDFEETMLELDRRISSMVAADSDSVARAGDSTEVSQAPEAWTPAEGAAAGADGGTGFDDDDTLPDSAIATGEAQAAVASDAGEPDVHAVEAGGFDDLVAADWPDEQDLPDATPVGLAAAGDAPAPVPGAEAAPQDAVAAADHPPAGEGVPEAGLPEPDMPAPDLAEPGPEESGLPVSGSLDAALQDDEDGDAEPSPLSLEEVLELAEASAEEQDDSLSGIDGDRLTPEDLATLTEMLEESVAAAEEQTADDDGLAGDGPAEDGDAPLNQASIADIADLIRAEQAAGMAVPEAAEGRDTGDADGEGGEDTRFELLDEEELQKGMTADRLFSADDYAEDGFGPVAAAEAEEGAEADDENAFDLSDLDLGGEIDGPPEAESEDDSLEGARASRGFGGGFGGDIDGDSEAAFEVIDDGTPADAPDGAATGAGGDGADAVTAEEEAELERWRAEVLGRVAQEAQEAAAARQGNAAGRAAGGGPAQGRRDPGGMIRGGPARGPDAEEDNALAELDAILAEEDLSYSSGSGGEWSAGGDAEEGPDLDPAFHVDLDEGTGPDLEIPPVHAEPRGGGLAPALREKLDADTRAEILARVRQSHGSGRDPGN
ncbi:hypothetical protein ACFOGJ_01155 [Marinibaculum pumilum]|uniref:Uncharacterized protein n=1 Tax=Marinibaculum pumilum TaxID=1766165 RepID=A0ABV7KTX9_9PROT